jgi:hypothetical protein
MILINVLASTHLRKEDVVFSPSFIIIIVVVAKPYADTRDKSGKSAYILSR